MFKQETVAKNVTHKTVNSMGIDKARAQVADYVELKKKQLAEKLEKEQGDAVMDLAEVTVRKIKAEFKMLSIVRTNVHNFIKYYTPLYYSNTYFS